MIIVNIPLLNLQTVAKNEQDIPIAIYEAIACFYISSEKFGKGFLEELKSVLINN